MWLSDAANATVRLFLAPVCLCCRAPLDTPLRSPVCPACWRGITAITPPCCVICGDALSVFDADGRLCARCEAEPPPFTRARSAGRYDGPLRALEGEWSFDPLGEDGCRIALALDFDYAGRLGGAALRLGFQSVASRMVDDFCAAARSIHG